MSKFRMKQSVLQVVIPLIVVLLILPGDVMAKRAAQLIIKKTDQKVIKGVLINVPDVPVIPYFTTVPWNSIPMEQEQADLTNGSYAAFNGGIKAYNAGQLPGQTEPPAVKRDTIHFKAGQNGVVRFLYG